MGWEFGPEINVPAVWRMEIAWWINKITSKASESRQTWVQIFPLGRLLISAKMEELYPLSPPSYN